MSAFLSILSVVPGNVRADVSGGPDDLGPLLTLPGDANGDGTVDQADLDAVLAHYNQTGVGWQNGDVNLDGTCNGGDLNIVLANFGKTSSVIPEPSSLVLFGVGAAGLLAFLWRRRRTAQRHGAV